jgi:hypothetical protein
MPPGQALRALLAPEAAGSGGALRSDVSLRGIDDKIVTIND